MKIRYVVCSVLLVALAAGCATTPDPVLTAGAFSEVVGETIESNFKAIMDGTFEKLEAAYTQGLQAAYSMRLAELTDAEGKIPLGVQTQLQAELAGQIEANRERLDREKTAVMDPMLLQFAIKSQLDRLLNAYNKAKGIPPESVQAFIDEVTTMAQMAKTAIEARGLQDQVQDSDGLTDWGALLRLIEERAFSAVSGNIGDLDIVELLRRG